MTWEEFTTKVKEFMPVDASRLNVATAVNVGGVSFLDNLIRQGVIDLQSYIPSFRVGHEDTFAVGDFTDNGQASEGTLPDQAFLKSAWYVDTAKNCARQPLVMYPWDSRFDLTCGNIKLMNCQYAMVVDPQGLKFLVFPKVETGYKVVVNYDCKLETGKTDFADDDDVPFTEKAAQCVANYCAAYIDKRVNRDEPAFRSSMNLYALDRTQIYLEERERSRLSETASSLQSDACCAPTPE